MSAMITLDSTTLDLATFVDADLVRVGQAFARLLGFYNDPSATVDTFACDAATYSAIRRAAPRVLEMARDKSIDVEWHRAPGTKTWKRVAKGAKVPQSHDRKTTTVLSHSSDAIAKGIETLRESHDVAIKRQTTRTTIDGTEYLVIALVRSNPTPVAA